MGIDVDTGEVVFTDDEMRRLLDVAHSPPDPLEQGGFSFEGEDEVLDQMAVAAFLSLSYAEKVDYLNSVSTTEAMAALMWADQREGRRLMEALSENQRRKLLFLLNDNTPVFRSA